MVRRLASQRQRAATSQQASIPAERRPCNTADKREEGPLASPPAASRPRLVPLTEASGNAGNVSHEHSTTVDAEGKAGMNGGAAGVGKGQSTMSEVDLTTSARAMFEVMDRDRSGGLSEQELRLALAGFGETVVHLVLEKMKSLVGDSGLTEIGPDLFEAGIVPILQRFQEEQEQRRMKLKEKRARRATAGAEMTAHEDSIHPLAEEGAALVDRLSDDAFDTLRTHILEGDSPLATHVRQLISPATTPRDGEEGQSAGGPGDGNDAQTGIPRADTVASVQEEASTARLRGALEQETRVTEGEAAVRIQSQARGAMARRKAWGERKRRDVLKEEIYPVPICRTVSFEGQSAEAAAEHATASPMGALTPNEALAVLNGEDTGTSTRSAGVETANADKKSWFRRAAKTTKLSVCGCLSRHWGF